MKEQETKIQSVTIRYENGGTDQKFHTAKYTIGDYVYFMYDNEIRYGRIDEVASYTGIDNEGEFQVGFKYVIYNNYCDLMEENELFESLDELTEHLKNNVENLSE